MNNLIIQETVELIKYRNKLASSIINTKRLIEISGIKRNLITMLVALQCERDSVEYDIRCNIDRLN